MDRKTTILTMLVVALVVLEVYQLLQKPPHVAYAQSAFTAPSEPSCTSASSPSNGQSVVTFPFPATFACVGDLDGNGLKEIVVGVPLPSPSAGGVPQLSSFKVWVINHDGSVRTNLWLGP